MKYCLKSFLVVLIINIFSTTGFASPTESYFDSILRKSPKDTNYVRTVEKYVWYLANSLSNIPKADSLLKATEPLAIQLKDYRGLVNIYFYQGLILYRLGKVDESFKSHKRAFEIVEKQKLPPIFRQKMLTTFANYYVIKFDSENALKYALQAIELTEKYHLTEYITPAYLVAAQIYKQIDKAKSEYFHKKAIQMAYRDSDSTQRYLAENTMAGYYLEKADYKKALVHAEKSMFWVEKFGRKANFSMAWNLLAEVYIFLKQPQKTKHYLDKSVKIAEEINDLNRMSDTYNLFGYYYFYVDSDMKKSEYYYKKSLEINKKTGNTYGVYACYESLVYIFEKIENYKEALKYDKEARVLKDSLFSKDWALKLNKLEIEKKETNLKLLQEQNKNAVFQRNALILGALALLIIAVGVIYFVVSRSKYKRFEEQQKLRNKLSADLHDEIGSSLSSISILSEIVAFQQQKGNNKSEIMQQVSNDARAVIEKMDDIIWTLNPKNDSVQNLETRLKTFSIPLFESKGIEFQFHFTSDLDALKIESSTRGDIYLILKEAINNLVKYSQCKNAIIEVKNEEKMLIFTVKDDGIGFDSTAETQRNGLRNMKTRAEKIGANLQINSSIGNGTEVKLIILAF